MLTNICVISYFCLESSNFPWQKKTRLLIENHWVRCAITVMYEKQPKILQTLFYYNRLVS